jgi:hypothetical protein
MAPGALERDSNFLGSCSAYLQAHSAGALILSTVIARSCITYWHLNGLLHCVQATKPTFRLHIYVQLGCKRSSTGPPESSLASEVSWPGAARVSAGPALDICVATLRHCMLCSVFSVICCVVCTKHQRV